MCLFRFTLFVTLCVSWTWMSASLAGLGKFLFAISSNGVFVSFSLYSPSVTPLMWMLVSLMLFQRTLKLSLFFFLILFLFAIPLGRLYYPVFQIREPFFWSFDVLLIPSSLSFIQLCSSVLTHFYIFSLLKFWVYPFLWV